MKSREPRKRVATPARMRTSTGWSDVVIRDISSRGLGLRSSRAPARGDYIEVCRHHHKLVARVVWSDGEQFGVILSDAIDVQDLLTSRPAPRPGCKDRRAERRSGAPQRHAADARFALLSVEQNSRYLSRIMNFGAVVALAGLGAVLAADFAGGILGHAMDAVSAGLTEGAVAG